MWSLAQDTSSGKLSNLEVSDNMVEREKKKKRLLEELRGGSSDELKIIPIVGMGGIGISTRPVALPYNSDIPWAVWNPPLTRWGSPQPEYAARVGFSDSDMPHGTRPARGLDIYRQAIANTSQSLRPNHFPTSGTPQLSSAITMELTAASAILAKLEAITRKWEVINEMLDHMGVPREQVGYLDTHQDEDRSSCELQGKNVIPYTHMNVVAVLPSVGVHESSFCDTLDIVRSHEDQTLVVGTQALVDPLDDDIDSPRENDFRSSGASTYNLTKVPLPSYESIHTLVDPCEKKGESTLVCEFPTTSEGEQNDQPGVDDLDLLEYLETPSCDCLCEDDFNCGPLASRDGLYVCEENSCEREGDMCFKMPSTLSLCVSYVGNIPSGNFETSSKCIHGNPLFEADLWNTFLIPLLVHDIFNSDKKGLLNFEDDTLGESESGRDLSPWLHLPFDPSNF
ncbi:hypothetical protein CQW23_06469 [Capsicum baccatum]|uniref:Uncharacterized protein n=1 Tax=Capsicum baccatum TaxID=33114 RepID=A0A2G2X3G8_CAPBA|nr:hypothetical protein CQW23_06469 [Capsicum baccatum]